MDSVTVGTGTEGVLDVALRGEIDFANGSQVIDVVRRAIVREKPSRVRVDLAEVTFLDSSGIAVLVNAMKAAEAAGATYTVVNPNIKVTDQLRITGLLEPFGLAEV